MSRLRIFDDAAPSAPLSLTADHGSIAAGLGRVGVRFERWRTEAVLGPGAPVEQMVAAYRDDVERLMKLGGYQAVDVVSLEPNHPDRETLRRKFLDEHTHGEDEVRFFVAGSGLFSLHLAGRIYEVRCERGDLISVPAGTPHWFDMGPQPAFVAIRLFTSPAGWVANFLGTGIAGRFPRYEPGKAG